MSTLLDENMTFGYFIREKRQAQGLKLCAVSAYLKISTVYLSDVERGKRTPFRGEKLKKLGKILELDPQDFVVMQNLSDKSRNISTDLNYLFDHTNARRALKMAQEKSITEDEWEGIIDYIDKL